MCVQGVLEDARGAAEEARRVRRLLKQCDRDARDGRIVPQAYRASLLARLDRCARAVDEGQAALDAMERAGTARGWVLDALQMRYLDAMGWDEISAHLCYSKANVRRAVAAALREPDREC